MIRTICLLLPLALWVGCTPPECCGQEGGVKLPLDSHQFRDRAVAIGQSGEVEQLTAPEKVFGDFVSTQLPASDKSQFWLVAYVDSTDPESRQLLRDFEQHPGLKQLRQWAKWIEVDRQKSPAADARHVAQQLRHADVPTIICVPHPGHPTFGAAGAGGWTEVYRRSGYGGDAGFLARNLYDAIRKTYQEHSVSQCPGPYCPDPQPPYQPTPIQPRPSPTPTPNDDWYVPAPLDEPTPRTPAPFGIQLGWTHLAAVIVGVLVAAFLVRRYGSPALLAACLLWPTAAWADTEPMPEPGTQTEDVRKHRPSGGNIEELERARLYPPVPDQWDWVGNVIRDEVRRAIDPVRVEGLLLDSLNHVEITIDDNMQQMRDQQRRDIEEGRVARWAGLGVDGITLLAVLAWLRRRMPHLSGSPEPTPEPTCCPTCKRPATDCTLNTHLPGST